MVVAISVPKTDGAKTKKPTLCEWAWLFCRFGLQRRPSQKFVGPTKSVSKPAERKVRRAVSGGAAVGNARHKDPALPIAR